MTLNLGSTSIIKFEFLSKGLKVTVICFHIISRWKSSLSYQPNLESGKKQNIKVQNAPLTNYRVVSIDLSM